MSFDLKCTYANDLCTFNEVEYCFSGCEIVKPCPQTLSPMVDQLLGIRSLYHKTKSGRVSKMWKCGGIIGTLNYSFTIRIVWTE